MTLKSLNPHDQSIVGKLNISSQAQVRQAVVNAKKAFPSWKETSIEKRVTYIQKFQALLKQNASELAKLTSLEMGKPLNQSIDDIEAEQDFIDYYITQGPKTLADHTVLKETNGTYRLTHEPYGVCACIAPWNFPLSMANSGILPALIAGNTVVFKPSEYTSLSQKMVVDLLHETGLPSNVLNLVIGGGDVGAGLIDEPIDLAWFTGSTKVGQQIFQKAGVKFIKALLEMGGSSPGIIFADANLDHALDQLYWGRFLNAGQVCTAIKRLFVEESVYDQVVNLFTQKLQTLKIGNPLDNPDIGPLVTQTQLHHLESQVQDALDKGAKIVIGGSRPKSKSLTKGNYYLPTILTQVKPNMRVMTEEVFGPVLPIVSFKTESQAINLANATDYGLSAEIYTSNLQKGERVAKQLEAGTVAINTDNFFKPECPFGGFKKSGMGKEYGELGFLEFTQPKLIAKVK